MLWCGDGTRGDRVHDVSREGDWDLSTLLGSRCSNVVGIAMFRKDKRGVAGKCQRVAGVRGSSSVPTDSPHTAILTK